MKNTIRISAFLVIAALLISGTYKVLSWKDTTGGYLSSTQQLYATEDNLMDVVFMGSSHCYCSINPSILWDTYGISAFDMAVSGQDKDSTYYALQELLKTQSPQVVCIDAYGLLFDRHEVLGNVYRNMLSMKFSSTSNDLIRAYVEEDEQLDFLLRWPIIHTRYRELAKYDFIQYEPSIYGRGFFPNYHAGNVSPLSEDILNCNETAPLSETNKQWIDNLISLSEEEGFSLVFFLAPMALSMDNQKVLNGANDYLQSYNIDFIDFNRLASEIDLDYTIDFADAFHTNTRGANKVTSYMGTYLMQNHLFIDHRGDEKYHLWDTCSQYMQQLETANTIGQTSDLSAYMDLLANAENMTVVISLDGSYLDSSLDLLSALAVWGIEESEYNMGGKWIFENGERVFYMDGLSDASYTHDLSQTETLRIQNPVNANTLSQIAINGKSYGSAINGLSVLAYDNFTDTIVSQKGFY